jgi:dienelactone hydrolase
VVLAHGFGGVREARLWAYAERFRAAGMAALVFDYRHHGDSEGDPRGLISIGRQQADWRAAVAFARALPAIDPDRIALWGTSYGGGHVVQVAAGDPRLAAVVAQTPFTDGLSALRAVGPVSSVRMTVAALRDWFRGVRGRDPLPIPLAARPGELGAMTQPAALAGYRSLFEDPADFHNEFLPRSALGLGFWRPARFASRIRCPLLVCLLDGDEVTPAAPARRMAERAPHGKCIDYGPAGGHFDIYTGEHFERTVADQTAFLGRALGVREAALG